MSPVLRIAAVSVPHNYAHCASQRAAQPDPQCGVHRPWGHLLRRVQPDLDISVCAVPRAVRLRRNAISVLFSLCMQDMLAPPCRSFGLAPTAASDQLGLAADDPQLPIYSGLLGAAYLLGQFLCSPFYGSLSERLGRRPVLLTCVAISTGFLMMFGFSGSYWLSIALRLLQGATAGALTVGKLYLSDVSDASNQGKVFSYIGVAMGTGYITGPALGGLLADPSLQNSLLPEASFAGALVRQYPYLPPTIAGALISFSVMVAAFFRLRESRPPAGTRVFSDEVAARLGKPLLINASGSDLRPLDLRPGSGRVSPSECRTSPINGLDASGGGAAPMVIHGSLLEAGMSPHASRTNLIIDDEEVFIDPVTKDPSPSASPTAERRVVSALELALRHATSPSAQRRALFERSSSTSASPVPSISPYISPKTVTPVATPSALKLATISEGTQLSQSQLKLTFWLVQAAISSTVATVAQ